MRNSIRQIIHGRLERQGALSGSLEFCPQADFFAFSGHFPGRPILPAMLQTRLALHLCEELAGHPLYLEEISRAKFMTPVSPDSRLRADARLAETGDGQFKAEIDISRGPEKIARLTLKLART